MPLSNFKLFFVKNQVYFKRLIVRCIEDLCFVLLLVVGIWLVCTVVGGIFRILGVA